MPSPKDLQKSWRTVALCERLKNLVTEEERAGFVLVNGLVIELANIAEDKANDFQADPAEILEHCDKPVVALWHTHPEGTANLSTNDWETFLAWPGIEHIIVARDETRFYAAKGLGVINLPLPE